jgi:hypothetical protein
METGPLSDSLVGGQEEVLLVVVVLCIVCTMRLTSPKEKRKPQRDLRCIMVVLNQRDTEEAEDQDRCDNEGLEPEHVIAWHRGKERGKKKGKKNQRSSST